LANKTEHTVLGGRLILRQPEEGYRAAIDPVLLAASVSVLPEQTVLDLGTGIGTAALCLARRCSGIQVTGLEIQEELVALARENTRHNNLDDAVRMVEADLNTSPDELAEASFDHVIANPPYFRADQAQSSPNRIKAVANIEGAGGLAAWLAAANRYLKEGGTLTVIHSADRLSDLIEVFAEFQMGSAEIFPFWPKQGRPAKRIIVRGRKGGRGATALHSGLVLHDENGSYSAVADDLLKEAGSLVF